MSSSKIFTPYSKTVFQVFGDSDSFFQVPSFQRPYSWEDEHVDDLWSDIYEAFQRHENDTGSDQSYFLGSIILVKREDYFEVIDGQQRLTTLTILFCVLRDLFPDLPGIKMVKNSVKDAVFDKERLRFKTALSQQNAFRKTILDKVEFPPKFTKKEKREKPYINTAILFRDKLQSLEKQEVQKLLNYIFNNVEFIVITCDTPSYAIRLFQVLNARGLDLTDADLIKSFLLEGLNETEYPEFVSTWQQIESIAKDVNQSVNDLLNYYRYFLIPKNPEKGLFEELSALFKGKEPNGVIHDFKLFCDSYKEIDSSDDKSIFPFFYLRQEIYWKSILTGAKFSNYQDIETLSKLLAKFYYLYWIAGYTSTKIKQTSFNIMQMVRNGASIEQISTEIDRKFSADRVLERVGYNLCDDVYGEAWLKPLFLTIEYSLTYGKKSFIELDSKIHVEHVLPVENSKYDYWKDLYTPEEAEKYLNSIANLTLLSGKKNVQASNLPFPDKLKIYNKKGIDGLTAFNITQNIYINAIDSNPDWDKTALGERFSWIIDHIENVFEIKIPNADFSEVKNQEVEIQEMKPGPDQGKEEKKFHPVNFQSECADLVSAKIGVKLSKSSGTLYQSDDSKTGVYCLASKEHSKTLPVGYWFAFHPHQKTNLEIYEASYVSLGCGGAEQTLLLPLEFIETVVEKLNVTESTERFYWHIHVYKEDGRFFLNPKSDYEDIEITEYLIEGKL